MKRCEMGEKKKKKKGKAKLFHPSISCQSVNAPRIRRGRETLSFGSTGHRQRKLARPPQSSPPSQPLFVMPSIVRLPLPPFLPSKTDEYKVTPSNTVLKMIDIVRVGRQPSCVDDGFVGTHRIEYDRMLLAYCLSTAMNRSATCYPR